MVRRLSECLKHVTANMDAQKEVIRPHLFGHRQGSGRALFNSSTLTLLAFCCCFSRMVPKPTRVNEQRRCINCNTTDAETDSKYKIFEDVCVMVSPNRQSHIVAIRKDMKYEMPKTSRAFQRVLRLQAFRTYGLNWYSFSRNVNVLAPIMPTKTSTPCKKVVTLLG